MSHSDRSADLIIRNARVATLAEGRMAEAVAVAGDRLLAVGADDQMPVHRGPDTRIIDAGGRLLVPGLIDGHAHMDREGLKDALPSLVGCRCIDDVLQRIQAVARDTPPGQWIVTMPIGEPPFYEGVPDNLREKRVPNRRELDRVAPAHPVYIRPIWGHWRNTLPLVSVANSLALEHVGMLSPEEVTRIRDLGLVLQAYTSKWIWQDGDDLRARHGEAAMSDVVPMRSLLEAGVHVSLATDNVPPSLFTPIHHVVARRSAGGAAIGADQALGRLEALACASREGAWLSFEEDFKGTLEPGKAADFAVLSEDLLSVETDRIPHIVADLTVTAGKVVYQRDGL